MLRRVYFLLPEKSQALDMVKELQESGIPEGHLHALAKPGIDLSGLPIATRGQQTDRVWSLERLFWNADLILFALSALGLVFSLYFGQMAWAGFSLALMVVAFIAGERFASKLPHGHLNQVQGALAHNEILLMVDLPRKRVSEVEHLVHRHHPEAEIAAVGWSMDALRT